jgi:DNA-binding MarR family transcriptional regulator
MMHNNEIEKIGELDAVIHNPARLMMVYLLSRNASMDYLDIMQRTQLSSGNMTTHLSKLAEAGYISITKSFVGKKPNTSIKITERGILAYSNWGEKVLFAMPERIKMRINPSGYTHPKAFPSYHDLYSEYCTLQGNINLPRVCGRGMYLPPVDESFGL